ncbi:hypothetical protein [Sphingomonas lenta]|uniref:Uncharacterized protein n=1 Tax=Sphingomonas lenta TaxID=1141887 RepID=A0A2A2SBN9_9SPHN|nr:hypothetical protein [Sphingomonas lenta]PAX06615.1 hypothetical protein CKY28_15825 [Sphingomonas lenta]
MISAAALLLMAVGEPVTAEAALRGLERREWTAFYERAAERVRQDRLEEAALAFYVGQLRGRTAVACRRPPEDEAPALLASFNSVLGEPINRWVGGSVKRWLRVIDGAIAWEQAHPDPATAGPDCAAAREQVGAGLKSMRAEIAATADQIRRERAANGLPNEAE